MTGKEEDRHLIDHFSGAEGLPRLRIGSGHDLGCQVIGRGSRFDLGHPFRRQPRDQPPDRPRGRPGLPPMPARQEARQGQEGGEVQDGLCALVVAELGEDLCRHLMFDRDGKERAENHIGCRVAHRLLDFDFTRLHACAGGLCGRPHGWKRIAQASALEGGVDDPPLTLPRLAIGEKDRVAQQRAQPLADPVGFGEIIGPLFQDEVQQRGFVDHETAKERCFEFGHPRAIEPRGLRRQDVLPEKPHVAPE